MQNQSQRFKLPSIKDLKLGARIDDFQPQEISPIINENINATNNNATITNNNNDNLKLNNMSFVNHVLNTQVSPPRKDSSALNQIQRHGSSSSSLPSATNPIPYPQQQIQNDPSIHQIPIPPPIQNQTYYNQHLPIQQQQQNIMQPNYYYPNQQIQQYQQQQPLMASPQGFFPYQPFNQYSQQPTSTAYGSSQNVTRQVDSQPTQPAPAFGYYIQQQQQQQQNAYIQQSQNRQQMAEKMQGGMMNYNIPEQYLQQQQQQYIPSHQQGNSLVQIPGNKGDIQSQLNHSSDSLSSANAPYPLRFASNGLPTPISNSLSVMDLPNTMSQMKTASIKHHFKDGDMKSFRKHSRKESNSSSALQLKLQRKKQKKQNLMFENKKQKQNSFGRGEDQQENCNIIERVKTSLLKNRQGRPITLDFSVNLTLYECLEDYILHYLRKNQNLDYWFSQEGKVIKNIYHPNDSNDAIDNNTSSDEDEEEENSYAKASDEDFKKRLKEQLGVDSLEEGDGIKVSNFDLLKILYLEKNELQKRKNLNFSLPVTKEKVIFDPRIDSFASFTDPENTEGGIKVNIFKQITVQNQSQFLKNSNTNRSSYSFNENTNGTNNVNPSSKKFNKLSGDDSCIVKKAQVLHTMEDGDTSILQEIKKKLQIDPNQRLAILKQYKRSMFPKEIKNRVGNGSESTIVMFDYIPIINEKEVNIEFFKKIICYPKYRTNYDLVLIKRGNDGGTGLQQFNNPIRCYFDRTLHDSVIENYTSFGEDFYKNFILNDINTALIGTMMSNYNGAINFQPYDNYNIEEQEKEKEHNHNSDVDLKGDFATLPNGLEAFEPQMKHVWQKEKPMYMCYDTWVLDMK